MPICPVLSGAGRVSWLGDTGYSQLPLLFFLLPPSFALSWKKIKKHLRQMWSFWSSVKYAACRISTYLRHEKPNDASVCFVVTAAIFPSSCNFQIQEPLIIAFRLRWRWANCKWETVSETRDPIKAVCVSRQLCKWTVNLKLEAREPKQIRAGCRPTRSKNVALITMCPANREIESCIMPS